MKLFLAIIANKLRQMQKQNKIHEQAEVVRELDKIRLRRVLRMWEEGVYCARIMDGDSWRAFRALQVRRDASVAFAPRHLCYSAFTPQDTSVTAHSHQDSSVKAGAARAPLPHHVGGESATNKKPLYINTKTPLLRRCGPSSTCGRRVGRRRCSISGCIPPAWGSR